MSRRNRSEPLVGLALCSLLIAGCGTGGPPSREGARNDIREAYIAQGRNTDTAAAIADCVSTALYESGEFTEDERNNVVRATDGDEPDPDLVVKARELLDSCEDDATSGPQTGSGSSDETTTTTEG